MNSFIRFVFLLLASIFSSMTLAQTHYEKIVVGSILTSGIGLDGFVDPIPLPAGEWTVVQSNKEKVPVPREDGGMDESMTRVSLSVLASKPTEKSVLLGIAMAFTPHARNIIWTNAKCVSKDTKTLVDDFGLGPEPVLFLCSSIHPLEDGLENLLAVDIYGNRHLGDQIIFRFIVKKEGDIEKDPAYAEHLKKWAHATGLSVLKFLENKRTGFELPLPYTASQTNPA